MFLQCLRECNHLVLLLKLSSRQGFLAEVIGAALRADAANHEDEESHHGDDRQEGDKRDGEREEREEEHGPVEESCKVVH